MLLMFVGGCAGSTGGGLKVIRHVLFVKILRLEVEQAFHPTVVRPFVATNKIPYPVVMGDQATVQKFGSVRAIPTAFLVDPEGYIVGRYEGLRDKRFFQKEIEKALAGAPAS